MGAVNFSLDLKLIERLKQVLPLSVFIETGTFEGEAVNNVISLFEEIHTIELSEEYYLKASKRFQGQNSVKVYQNSSEHLLQILCPLVKDKSVLYWLDAHWCVAESTAGYHSQCPLLQELDAIQALNAESVILIDDARLFLCPPPSPHEVSQWPDFNTILQKLVSLSSVHEIMVVNDVIVYYPSAISSSLKAYAYENSIDWLSVLDKSRDYDSVLLQLNEKENQINMLAATTEERDNQIKMLTTAAEEKENQINMLAATAEEKENQINMLAATAEEKETQIKMLAATAEERDNQIKMLTTAAKERDNQIKMLTTAAEEKETQIKMLAATAEERLHLIQQLHDKLKAENGS